MAFETEHLEQICELVIDCPHSTPTWLDEGILVIRNTNIRNGRLDFSKPSFTNEENYQYRSKRAEIQENDIIFTREAPMGEVCIIPKGLKACVGQRQVLLRAGNDINPKYLFYALQSPYVQHQVSWNEGTGTTVSNIRIPFLKNFLIPRNKNSEDQIAHILSTLDDKIELNRKMNETLEAMAQAIFKSWFVDFDPVHAKAEAKSEADLDQAAKTLGISREILDLFPSTFVESEMGLVPEGWEECKLSDVLEIKYGKDHKKLSEGNIPVYGSGGVMRYVDSFLYDEESILIPRKGTLTNLFYVDEPFWTVDTIFWSKINTAKVSGKFLFSFLKTIDLSNLNVGSAVPSLTTKVLNEVKIATPTIDEQNEFNKYADNAWKKMKNNIKEIRTLEEMRNTLLPKLLSGELDVSELEVE